MLSSFVLSQVTFAFDAKPLLDDVTITIPATRVGVVGRNGAGKSTLLRLLAADLSPTTGSIKAPDSLARLPQDLVQRCDLTVAALLGIEEVLAALERIEAGSINPADYETVGERWDVASRAISLLSARVPSLSSEDTLNRPLGTLSGGEIMLTALAGLEFSNARTLLLDEPTNNLDRATRTALYSWVEQWTGGLVVVSHDIALLRRMDHILEVNEGALTLWGGNYDHWQEQSQVLEAATEQRLRDAERRLRAEQRERKHVQTATARQARRDGQRFATVKQGPRLSDPEWKSRAEGRRAQANRLATQKVQAAREEVSRAAEAVTTRDSIKVDLPELRRARGRQLAELGTPPRAFTVRGGDRIALIGDNGVGKTTLLRQARLFTTRVGWIDQHVELPTGCSVLECLRRSNPEATRREMRALLARFLLRGEIVERPVETLSGGERFRAALARVLLATPPPELLLLDEPTNNLDLETVAAFVEALAQYRGALVLITHDDAVLERLELDAVLTVTGPGELTLLRSDWPGRGRPVPRTGVTSAAPRPPVHAGSGER
ncbi:MAG: ABC-F family ATP-binding cassette domain-containing protein [Propionibacteriaceae bacterium]|nr:ABC-F family ATP-binding cassette domain-containing protein [Propionibacteriaceae bacterium]